MDSVRGTIQQDHNEYIIGYNECGTVISETHVLNEFSAISNSQNKGINITPANCYQLKRIVEASSIKNEFDRLDFKELREKDKDHMTLDKSKQKKRYDEARKNVKKCNIG